eukprot:gene14140-17189_t
MRSIVKAVNLNKYYDQYHALQDINLEVEQGELEKIDKGGLWVDGELVGYRVVGNKLHELNESQIARPCQVLKRSPKEATEDALELLARVGLADKQVLSVMRDLATTGMTMIVVTHELGFAREVSNRMVFMDAGQIVEAGSPEEILISPQNPRTQSFISAVRT